MYILLVFTIISCWVTAYPRTSYGKTPYENSHVKYQSDELAKLIKKKSDLFTKQSLVFTPLSPNQPTKPANMGYQKNFQQDVYDSIPKPRTTTHSDENMRVVENLSMEVGDKLIKVSSVLHSKESPYEFKRPDLPRSDIHHVIEVLPMSKKLKLSEEDLIDESTTETAHKNSIDSKILLEQTSNESENEGISESRVMIEGEPITFKPIPIKGEQTTIEDKRTTVPEDPIAGRAGNDGADGVEGSGDIFNIKDEEDNVQEISGRLLSILSRANDSSPVCTTPKGEPGRCRRFRQCILIDALENFNNFLQYLCIVRGISVGICCPDNPVIEITNPDNSTEANIKVEIQQPPEGCGLNVKTRIVGGTISIPHEWSWMVALLRRNRFYCGGVVINNWYILTAAHCVLGINVKDLTVRLGEYNFTTEKGHEQDFSVAEIKRHAQFVTLTFQHDIALLKLKRSIRYSKFAGSICLPDTKARDYSDVSATVVGWGTVSFGGAASPVLRQVSIPVWKNEDCDRTYVLETIGDSFLCAGAPAKGEDACQGDSGGPLMALSSSGRWEVIGLVSWGRRCGDPTYPGVYTRITTYLDWISQNAT